MEIKDYRTKVPEGCSKVVKLRIKCTLNSACES